MSRRLFWASVVVGWAMIAFGVAGMVSQRADTRPAALARLLFGLVAVHDLVAVPVVLGLGVLVARWVPGPLRASVQGGLVASAVVSLFAWPLVRGYGRTPDNASALPLDYGRGLVILLAVIWAVAAVAGSRSWLRRRRSRP